MNEYFKVTSLKTCSIQSVSFLQLTKAQDISQMDKKIHTQAFTFPTFSDKLPFQMSYALEFLVRITPSLKVPRYRYEHQHPLKNQRSVRAGTSHTVCRWVAKGCV